MRDPDPAINHFSAVIILTEGAGGGVLSSHLEGHVLANVVMRARGFNWQAFGKSQRVN